MLGKELGFLKEHLQYYTANFQNSPLSKLGILYMEEALKFKASELTMIRVFLVGDL